MSSGGLGFRVSGVFWGLGLRVSDVFWCVNQVR